MMTEDIRLDGRLGELFDEARGGLREELDAESYERARHDFVFHMTDWKEDLKGLAEFFEAPSKFDNEAASQIIIGFLYHVIPHLNAAGRLLLDEVRDPFVTVETPRQSR